MNDTKMKTNSNDELRLKRTQTMIGVWDYLVKNNQIDGEKFHLSKPLVNEIIEQYITDVDFLKKRYQIVAKIQLHKIAGLMASLIVKYRPVISLMDEYTTENELYVNELLAIIHGLSVCGEFNTNEENARFLMDFITKEVRMSTINSSTEASLNITRSDGELVIYTFSSGRIERTTSTPSNSGPISSDQVIINGSFHVEGISGGDFAQPKVTISMEIKGTGAKIEEQAKINIQTTISQRNFDL